MEKTQLKLVGSEEGNNVGQTLEDFIDHFNIVNWKAGDNVVISGENYLLQEVLKEANERCTYKALRADGKVKKLKVIQFFRKEKALEAKQKLSEIYRKANTAYSDKNDFDYRLINANNLDLIIECNYLDGKDARQVLKDNNRNFTQQEVAECLLSVLNNDVKKLHLQGLVHRDVNPNNLIGDSFDGKVDYRLVDVGSSREIGTGLTTGAGELFTYPYSRISAFHYATDDLYSLARLSYFLLTGKEPECCITDKKADELCDGRNYNSLKIDKKLRKILFKMAGHGSKYKSVDELIKDLENFKNFKSSKSLKNLEQGLVKSKGKLVSNLEVLSYMAFSAGYIIGYPIVVTFAFPSCVRWGDEARKPLHFILSMISNGMALGNINKHYPNYFYLALGLSITTNTASLLYEIFCFTKKDLENERKLKEEKENPAVVANEKGFYQKWKENREIKIEEKAKKDLELRVYREENIITAMRAGSSEGYTPDIVNKYAKLRKQFFKGLCGNIYSEEQITHKIYEMKFATSLEKAKEITRALIDYSHEQPYGGYYMRWCRIPFELGDWVYAKVTPLLGENDSKLYHIHYENESDPYD